MLNQWMNLGSKRKQAILLLVLTNLLWSSGGVLIKWVDWHPLAISGARSAIAALIIRAAFYRSSLTWSRPQVLGAFAYAGTVMLFVAATKLTTAANAILLQYTAPVYVALMAGWLLREKPTRLDWAAIAVIFFGMLLFFQDQVSAGGVLGNLMGLGSGITLAAFAICMRSQKDEAPFGSVLIGNIITAVVGIPFMLGSVPDASGIMGLAMLGVFQLGLSYVLYSVAIKELTALEVTLLSAIEPVLNPFWVFLIMGESPGLYALVGGAIIFVGVTLRCAMGALAAGPAQRSAGEYSPAESRPVKHH